MAVLPWVVFFVLFTWCTLGRTATMCCARAFPDSVNMCWHKASPALPPDAHTNTKSHNVWRNAHTTSMHTSVTYLQLVSYRTLRSATSESFCTNEEAFPSNPTPGDEHDKETPSFLFKYQFKQKMKLNEQQVLTWKYSSMAFLT